MADELTEALKELREMFPRYHVRVAVSDYAWHNPALSESRCHHGAAIVVAQVHSFGGATLSEAMAQVRSWKAAQEEKERDA